MLGIGFNWYRHADGAEQVSHHLPATRSHPERTRNALKGHETPPCAGGISRPLNAEGVLSAVRGPLGKEGTGWWSAEFHRRDHPAAVDADDAQGHRAHAAVVLDDDTRLHDTVVG